MTVATRLFRRRGLTVGQLCPGAVADWVLIPYQSPCPVASEGVGEGVALMHLLFGVTERSPREVVCEGRTLLRDGVLLVGSEEALLAGCRDTTAKVCPRPRTRVFVSSFA